MPPSEIHSLIKAGVVSTRQMTAAVALISIDLVIVRGKVTGSYPEISS